MIETNYDDPYAGGGAPAASGDWFDQQPPPPAAAAPAAAPSAQDFGNLSDPRQWDALVADPARLRQWIKANNPGWGDQLVDYYAGVITKQPGANDTEKAGSAQYYINDKFKKDPFYTGASGIGLGGFGSLASGWDQTFHAPNIDEIRAMPGYQFALKEGVGALDTAAAGRGTVLNGGQKKDILQYATGLLDQTAQQKYQNALGEYMNAYNIFRNNQSDVFDRYDRLAQRGTNAAGAATA